ncbi:MAG: hypothetical protein M3R26_05985 [Actinomycetota bacterium]|nr:hypothetical protein [Actinomycetota bacterium]
MSSAASACVSTGRASPVQRDEIGGLPSCVAELNDETLATIRAQLTISVAEA